MKAKIPTLSGVFDSVITMFIRCGSTPACDGPLFRQRQKSDHSKYNTGRRAINVIFWALPLSQNWFYMI